MSLPGHGTLGSCSVRYTCTLNYLPNIKTWSSKLSSTNTLTSPRGTQRAAENVHVFDWPPLCASGQKVPEGLANDVFCLFLHEALPRSRCHGPELSCGCRLSGAPCFFSTASKWKSKWLLVSLSQPHPGQGTPSRPEFNVFSSGMTHQDS